MAASNPELVAAPRGHTVISRSYRVPSTPHPPDPQKRRVGNSLRALAQDDTSTFMNNPGEGPHYPRCTHSGNALIGGSMGRELLCEVRSGSKEASGKALRETNAHRFEREGGRRYLPEIQRRVRCAWYPLRGDGRPCPAARADNTAWRDGHAPNAALRSCR